MIVCSTRNFKPKPTPVPCSCILQCVPLFGKRRLSDLVGADIGLHVGKNFIESFPERVYPAQIISLLNDHKRLGEKTGSGFYKFDKK